ncbi:UNVERIFIED_CONTAM: hypothetical protein Sindi_2949200, partial [Sesamum indicum]
MDGWIKAESDNKISVIDLLGDGGGNSNEEEDSTHAREAHVAFSIEDIGKVGTETPVHSPKIAGRSFPNGFSSPEKGRRQSISSRHFDYGFHDLESPVVVMMQDIDFSPYDNSKEKPSCSRSMRNIVEYPNQTFLNFGKSSPFNCNVSKLQGVSGTDELIYNIQDSGRNIWNNESPFPYRKHQNTEDLPDVIISETMWYAAVEIDNGVKDAVDHFVTEDARDSLSLL